MRADVNSMHSKSDLPQAEILFSASRRSFLSSMAENAKSAQPCTAKSPCSRLATQAMGFVGFGQPWLDMPRSACSIRRFLL